MSTAILILAAGDGRQMKSVHPKALCRVLFKPIISWVLDACAEAGYAQEQICVVCGQGGEELQALLPPKVHTVWQEQCLGTGRAAAHAESFLRALPGGSQVLILFGDAPLISAELIQESWRTHLEAGARLTVIDTAAMWADVAWLLSALPRLQNNDAQGENYLPGCAKLAAGDGVKVLAYGAPDSDAVLRADSCASLLKLNRLAARRVLEKQMENGVEVLSEDGVLIGPEVVIGAGSTVYPGTILKGKTVIGAGCTLGPNTVIEDSTVGDGCVINASQIENAVLEQNISMGPFAHIRPNSHIGSGVHLGNFTEVKNSSIGDRTSVSHLTYVGDSDVGEAVNFGCGCVTVNYDGMNKHRTTIGNHAFIGCNTNLVAPVKVGDFGFTAAGSTITEDVPENALAIERGKQYNKAEWSKGKIKIK